MAIITRAGQADIATASFEHLQVNWSKFVIGDANGVSYVPVNTQESLVHQVYEGEVSGYRATDEITGVFDLVLPADTGGFMVREIGILNEDNELVAVDCLPQDEAVPKVKFDSESTSRFNDMVIHFVVHIDNSDVVRVQVDPYSAVASKGYVDETIEDLKKSVLEMEQADVERVFQLEGGPSGGYPEDWEEATNSDIDALFA